MALLNPYGAVPVTLSFTRLSTIGGTVDEFGNAVLTETIATAQAIVTPLGAARLSDLAPIVGVEGTGIPVKVRVAAWPAGVGTGAAVASLTYNGRSATIRLAPIREANVSANRVLKGLGISCEGVLTYS
jgi:hypothetical protein